MAYSVDGEVYMTNYLNEYIQGLLSPNGKTNNLAQNMQEQGAQQLQTSMQAKNALQNNLDSMQSSTTQQAYNALQQQQTNGSALGNFLLRMGLNSITGGLGGTATNTVNPTFYLKT